MKLVNIYNNSCENNVYLFCRDSQGNLQIKEDDRHHAYFYEPHPEGNFLGYDGAKLKKLIVSAPRYIYKQKSSKSYESDISFCKKYLIDHVDTLEKTVVKYAFIDIEVLADELPNVQQAKYPVSCISVYNSANKKTYTFYTEDYESEYKLIDDFIKHMQEEKYDIWFSWNVQFDYDYLYNRFPDFDKRISPIGKNRYGRQDLYYPAGLSIVDYLGWFKKVTLNREKSYALDSICQKHLGEEAYQKVEFGKLSRDIIEKNKNDVLRMAKLEEKFKLVPYFDEVRRMAKVEWEDMTWNSRTIDMLLLQEAKEQNIILPMKPKDNEKEDYAGAYREAYELGSHFGVSKYDLSSAYPYAIIDFCLDSSNVIKHSLDGDQRTLEYTYPSNADTAILIEDTMFKQNEKALLPTIIKKLVNLKGEIKDKLDNTEINTAEHKDIKMKYNAIKTIVNSAYGVMGNRFFRLYDKRVASATTYIVRDVLHYVKDKIEELGYKVIYVDTDSIFLDTEENLTELLNTFVQDWVYEVYKKEDTNIEFAYEGVFESLLIVALCRYIGRLKSDKGIEEEIKGIEAKRKDSTIFIKKFQKEFLNMILDKKPKEEIITWIKSIDIKELPIKEISFPCKLARQPEDYKNTPIFLRALRSTPDYNKKVGDPFYYIFMEGKDEKKKDLVMAFDEENYSHIDRDKINWDIMYKRNITMKIQTIFDCMGWNMEEIL